jgi:hypothetical protein
MEEIDIHFKDFPPIKYLISKYSISATVVVSMYLFLAFLLTLSHSLGWFIVLLTGILYPGYHSILSLSNSKEEDFQLWISFWIIFSLHNFVDYLLGDCLAKVPFYYSTRLLITIYLFWPTTKGSLVIFKSLDMKFGLQLTQRGQDISGKTKKDE